MSPEERRATFLAYWRNSLADADRRSIQRVPSTGLDLTPMELEDGRLSRASLADLEKRAPRFQPRGDKALDSRSSPGPWPVALLIAPFGLRSLHEHGKARGGRGREHLPLAIPAWVEEDGTLRGDASALPWIGRSFLEPVFAEGPVVGSIEAVDLFLTRTPRPADDSWGAYREFAEALFTAVHGRGWRDLEVPEYEVLAPWGVMARSDQGMSQAILNLYDHLRDDGVSLPSLLSSLIDGVAAGSPPPPLPARHLGQMGRDFSSSPSQRRALHAALSLDPGQLASVNGPPGTGKTTLLQSVVASLWVESALAGQAPATVLGCSTNNRAIQNILDSFASITVAKTEPPEPLARRWLPGLGSYGLYFPARTKYGQSRYLEAAGREGFPATVESPRFVAEATPHYLACAREAWPRESSKTVREVVEQAHRLLAETHRGQEEALSLAGEVERLRLEPGSEGLRPEDLEREIAAVREKEAELKAWLDEVRQILDGIPFWQQLLSFLPPIREHRDRRLRLFLMSRGIPVPEESRNLAEAVLAWADRRRDELEVRRRRLESWQETERRYASRLYDLAQGRDDLAEAVARAQEDPSSLDLLLDRTARYRMFLLAGRYWEGRWLLEMADAFATGRNLDRQSRADCEARFRRYAMLTPCFIATFHQAPKAFDSYLRDKGSMPLLGYFDLLIVDEAGQVAPEVGAATFALGRKALVVGDIHQIEPVWSLTRGIDHANLRRLGLDPDREEVAAASASEGSLMLLAQRATAFSDAESRGGILLTEHRRSVPEVIRFSNELVYGGRLEPLRPSLGERILPPLGWAHVTSPMSSRGGSRFNPGEARAIASWLASRKEELERHYRGGLAELVAVITPFASQSGCLKNAFRSAGIPGVQAGTVHTFQGGERPIVLFSPVYSASPAPPPSLFFDAGKNLLNVAVSRAKDSFLVFGDMRLFDRRKGALPSGHLANLLFADPDNEITDVTAAQQWHDRPTQRLSSLDEHRETLARALRESRSRLLIASPYLTLLAVEADRIASGIAETYRRGVRVTVIYSPSGDLKAEWRTERAAAALAEAGAEVRPSARMHSKTLAVDSSWIVEGSFNWLSASREPKNPHQKYESSILHSGEGAAEFIEQAWKELLGLAAAPHKARR